MQAEARVESGRNDLAASHIAAERQRKQQAQHEAELAQTVAENNRRMKEEKEQQEADFIRLQEADIKQREEAAMIAANAAQKRLEDGQAKFLESRDKDEGREQRDEVQDFIGHMSEVWMHS